MAKSKELTVISYQEIANPETGEITAVPLDELTPEQSAYYRKLRTDRLVAACKRILERDPAFAVKVLHD